MPKLTEKTRKDFNYLVELAMKESDYSHMRPVIEKELLHYDLLFALDKNGLLDKLTFLTLYEPQIFSHSLAFSISNLPTVAFGVFVTNVVNFIHRMIPRIYTDYKKVLK